MPTTLETLEAEALKLSPADRAHLLERLFISLDVDTDIEAQWDAVADRRDAEIASGTVKAVSGPEAMARLQARISR